MIPQRCEAARLSRGNILIQQNIKEIATDYRLTPPTTFGATHRNCRAVKRGPPSDLARLRTGGVPRDSRAALHVATPRLTALVRVKRIFREKIRRGARIS